MQLMSMLASPVPGAAPRGRRPVEADPRERELHLAVATARLIHKQPVDQLAAGFDVSARTIHYWTDKALTYEGKLAAALRRFKALAASPSASN
jgi:hypothetical protein